MGVARRFVKFGGAVSDTQMKWLRDELGEAAGLGERVIVCSHLVQGLGLGSTAYGMGKHVVVCSHSEIRPRQIVQKGWGSMS